MIKLRFDRVGLVSLIRNGAACATFKSRSASCSAKNADEFGPSLLLAGHEPRPPGARRLLASTRAPVCAPTRMPPPPIIAACTSVDKLQVRKLLEKDAGLVHEGGPNGNLPLHCAVAKESAASLAVIKILLEFKAEVLAENDHGDTPLSVAKAKGHGKIVALLEEAAAAEEAAEAVRKKAAKEAKAAKKAAAAGDGGGGGTNNEGGSSSLQYRRTDKTGWKPLKKGGVAPCVLSNCHCKLMPCQLAFSLGQKWLHAHGRLPACLLLPIRSLAALGQIGTRWSPFVSRSRTNCKAASLHCHFQTKPPMPPLLRASRRSLRARAPTAA